MHSAQQRPARKKKAPRQLARLRITKNTRSGSQKRDGGIQVGRLHGASDEHDQEAAGRSWVLPLRLSGCPQLVRSTTLLNLSAEPPGRERYRRRERANKLAR